MEEKYYKDNFLARWASGDITDEEMKAFEATEDKKYFDAILGGTEVLDVPELDKEDFFNKLWKRKQELTLSQDKKVISLIPKWAFGIAASIALLIGYFVFFDNTMSYETGFGEQLVVTLPDNSEVLLNTKSKLEYNKKDWEDSRNLKLEGTGYFKVEKGSKFLVETSNGNVSVLGTQFSVNSQASIFEVICFEGSVKIENTKNQSKILKKGDAVRTINNELEPFNVKDKKPQWVDGKTSFVNAPIEQVIKALEDQYGVTINSDNIDSKNRFTGTFVNNDINVALKLVFEPLDINFTFINNKTISLVVKK